VRRGQSGTKRAPPSDHVTASLDLIAQRYQRHNCNSRTIATALGLS
jgi:hypothetical protein